MNGWQRIGIVASVIWMLGVSGWLWISVREEQNITAEIHVGDCWNSHMITPDVCQIKFVKELDTYRRYLWYADLVLSVVPVTLSWFCVYGIIALMRWIRSGFRHHPDILN